MRQSRQVACVALIVCVTSVTLWRSSSLLSSRNSPPARASPLGSTFIRSSFDPALFPPSGLLAASCRSAGFPYVVTYGPDPSNPTQSQGHIADFLKVIEGDGVLGPLWCGREVRQTHRTLRPSNRVYIDIGAHAGMTVMPYWSLGFKVIAFEPIPNNIDRIRGALLLNNVNQEDFELIHAAVSDHSQEFTQIFTPGNMTDNSAMTPDAAEMNVGLQHGLQKFDVPMVSIDDYLSGADPDLASKIAYIKIDAQGHELHVLKGMKNFLKSRRSQKAELGADFMIKAEFDQNLHRGQGNKDLEMLTFMRGLGFTAYCDAYGVTGAVIEPQVVPTCQDVIFLDHNR